MNDKVIRIEAEVGQFSRVTRNYSGLENDATVVAIDNTKSTIEVQLKSHQYGSKLEFPNVGNSAVVYLDRAANKAYRWDENNLKYYCVGSNYEDIKIINGGTANE
jgi:hypothetical protein